MFVKALIDFLFPRYCEMCNERLEVDDDVISVSYTHLTLPTIA